MCKILIVDDSNFMRQVLKSMLSKHGFNEIVEADNGVDAIKLYATEKPNLVILDLIMPEKNGFSTLIDIIEMDEKAQIIGCSSANNNVMIKDFVSEHIKGFVMKPFTEQELMSVIKRVLPDM